MTAEDTVTTMRSDRLGITEHLLAGEIVVGVSDTAPVDGLDRYDVLLTSVCDPPAPWVEGTLDELDGPVQSSPVAAVTIVQLLRATESVPVAAALTMESIAYSMLQHGEVFQAWLRGRDDRGPHPITEPSDPVTLARSNGTLEVELQRPHVHNAFDTAMRDALCDAFDLVALDPTITEVHLRGRGPSFCSGGDLTEFGAAVDAGAAHLIRVDRSVGRRVAVCADRVTAHLHGSCIGAGIEIPAFAAHVLADPSTTIRLPEVGFGLIPGAGGTVSIPRRIGRHRTAYLALTGRSIAADTARSWGLVDAVVPPAGSTSPSPS
jgi:enoyl-CoA hydratase/carnithine racemase